MILSELSDWLGLVTSEHFDRPRFIATLGVSFQPYDDLIAALGAMPAGYDVDAAVGVQLDAVGLWVGVERWIAIPLDPWFRLDVDGLGLDQGIWYDPRELVVDRLRLDDDYFRLLIYARIGSDHWDGTIPGAYDAWAPIETITGFEILIQDYGDMSMAVALFGMAAPDPLTLALFSGGYLTLKPAGVRVHYLVQSAPAARYFGFDVDNAHIGGLDRGAWGLEIGSA